MKGQFPIGFKVWDTKKKTQFTQADIDVYDAQASYLGKKTFGTRHKCAYINDWMKQFRSKSPACAKLCYVSNNFQNNIKVRVCSAEQKIFAHDVIFNITKDNLLLASIYFSVRKCIEATWLNDRDQFFFPNDGWKIDREFQSDCLTYTLFSNNIQTKYGINHWIPFIESDVQSPREFESHFMTDFILDKGLIFSSEAKAVFDAGRELWRYYLSLPNANINTSLYSIREHFQGRSAKGTMNARNDDITYTLLIGKVRSALKTLSTKIAPKVYEFGFLKK